MSIIDLKNLSKSFFGAKALDGMNFTVNEGEVHCLIGENGSGKSSMIKIVSGFYDYDEGELYINNKLFKKLSPIESMRQGIQVIYQDFSLFPNLSIGENILMYERSSKNRKIIIWNDIRKKAKEALKNIDIHLNVDELVGNLSVGQKQIIAICRALIQDAKLIIMDEPTTALTYKEVDRLYNIVNNLCKKGISVLFVSHKLDEVMAVSQKVTVIRNGMNVFSGSTSEINKEKLIFYMTARKFTDTRFEYTEPKQPVMEVINLGLNQYFDGINFSLHAGEILGITGLLGCGRTELAESLFGLKKYTSGRIKIHGEDVSISSVQDAIRQRLGYVPEDRITEGLHMDQNIGDNAIACITNQLLNKLKLFDRRKVQERKEEALGKITITGMQYKKPAKTLSGGNQQKLVFAKWLISDPEIFILNCPTVGVDVGSKAEIHQIIRELTNKGISIIVISDDLPELLQGCNRILLMHDGHIIQEMDTRGVTLAELENRIKKAI